MLKVPKIPASEITPYDLYLNRRAFMAAAGSLTVGALALAGCGPAPATAPEAPPAPTSAVQAQAAALPDALAFAAPTASAATDETGANLNSYDDITSYTNFYEFTTDKEDVARVAAGFNPVPWTVEVSGLVDKPLTLDLDDIYHQFTQEERIFRLRCVEAWSMVIPWVGFALGDLLALAEPKSTAQFVKFTSVLRPEEMPGQKSPLLEWPYVEGLRMDEAMNELATLATGMYGQPLTNQQGAPFRLVVPWKYGFKSIKSVVKIELVDTMPAVTWAVSSPKEYGFYANVNPAVNHPRWSQATERRIGEVFRRKTVLFNGYGDQVAALYDGMDLSKDF
jgi:sulfoxide reductase catalytic subunit YedY